LRLWGTLRGRRADADIKRELDNHLEMAEEALLRRGHSRYEAARLARVQFGRTDNALDSMRAQRSIPALNTFSLDVKLGLRMLRKHLALTVIGGLALAGAMTFGTALFHAWHVGTQTELPLDEGDRIVVLQPWDPVARVGLATSVADFERWRETLSSVENVSAFRLVQRNLVTGDGSVIPVQVAQMTAAGFRVASVSPMMGRALAEQDESPAAPPVVVIGYEAWQSRFGADPDVLGRTLELDDVAHTVVGVMPDGFRFPVSHQYWTNATTNASDRVVVFGRLAPSATLDSANGEIRVAGLDDPTLPGETGEPVEPRVVPYVTGIIGEIDLGIMLLVPLLLPLVLLPPCANIAILIYARTIARRGEFAARAVLGATRSRIIAQIFVEMLVLAAGAAALALVLAPKLLDYLRAQVVFGDMPFWIDLGYSYATIGYVAALAVVAALVAGAIPAIRATGRGQLAGLQALAARSVPRLGRVWTALVMAQVALAAATLPIVAELAWAVSGPSVSGARFAPEDYLVAYLGLDGASADDPDFAEVRAELARRLAAEPGVTAVTFAQAVPSNEPLLRIEVEGIARAEATASVASAMFNRVDAEFFSALGVRPLIGRGFDAGDSRPGADSIVVNQTFADQLLDDANPLGRRLRVLGAADGADTLSAGQWLEIVGVVEDFSAKGGRPTFYQPSARAVDGGGQANDEGDGARTVLIHAASGLLPALADRLRDRAATVDPNLRVDRIATMDRIYSGFSFADTGVASTLAGVMLGVLLLSAAGVYTLMAFAVVQRRREIGIRSALGAQPWILIAGISRRVLGPVAVAAGVGALGAALLEYYFRPTLFNFMEGGRPLPWILPAGEAFILLTGFLVIAGPARRALRIDPVETLRDE
jgi:predicted permease